MSTGRTGTAGPDAGRRALVESRLREFHGVGVDDILEIIGYLREPGDTVFAGGSLSFGLGNRLSDFDVVVCGPRNSTSKVPLQHWAKTLRVDVWTRAGADIDRVFAQAEAALARTTPIAGAFGTVEEEQQLKLLHRVAFGLHLDGPALSSALEPGGGPDRDFAAVARDLVVREYAERMRESAYVARLAAGSGRWLAATVNAREAVEEAMHVLLAAWGVPFTGDKWLHERLKTHAPDLREAYRRFAALPAAGPGCARFVADAVELCTELTGLDLDPEGLGRHLAWVAEGLALHTVGPVPLLLAPRVGGLWELSARDRAAWDELSARARPAAGTDPASHTAWPGAGLEPDQAELCLGLYERGLVALVWDRGVPVTELAMPDRAGGTGGTGRESA